MTDTQAPEPFVLPGWDYSHDSSAKTAGPAATKREKAPKQKPAKPGKPSKGRRETHHAPKKRRGVTVFFWLMMLLLLAVGGVLVYLGLSQSGQVEDAPVPKQDISVSVTAPAVGPGDELVDTNAGPMNVANMAPLHYFIPAMGVYSEIVPSTEFGSTRYSNFEGLRIPSDSQKTAWYGKGGALAPNTPDTAGTTLLASHVTYNGQWGVLKELYNLQGGEVVYVKDEAGVLTAWKVTDLFTKMHTDFPQEFFSSEGRRQLVLTTCGDYDWDIRHYLKNIFAVAVPVDPETLMPFPEPTPAPSPTPTPTATGAAS